jgi:hypothetical protein
MLGFSMLSAREPAMAKKLGKSEKLDLILSELSALRADIKALQREGSREQSLRPGARARPAPAKKPAKRTEAPDKVAKSTKGAKSKPVLVETDEEDESPQPASRIA